MTFSQKHLEVWIKASDEIESYCLHPIQMSFNLCFHLLFNYDSCANIIKNVQPAKHFAEQFFLSAEHLTLKA